MTKLHEQSLGSFSKKLHELTGQITSKELRKVYDKNSPYHGNTCYKLQALIENKKAVESLFVYPNLVSEQIYQTIEQSHYIDKRYLFFCEKKAKGWVLHTWKELSPLNTYSVDFASLHSKKNHEQ